MFWEEKGLVHICSFYETCRVQDPLKNGFLRIMPDSGWSKIVFPQLDTEF